MASNKIALVTGGSRGLGSNTVIHLAKKGISSIFTYHANKAAADKTLATAAKEGATAVALPLNTGDTASFDAFVTRVKTVLATHGWEKINYLVNNAGISHHNAIAQTTEAELDLLYQVNFKGVFFLTQKLLPLLADGGSIVNISSGLTRVSVPESGPYASLKGAIEVLTRYLAKELGPRRITVNTVAPGAIQTDFSGGMVRDNPEVNRMVASMTALGRAGEPDDIGPMIVSLLGAENRWVNGQRIEVAGGMVL